MHCDMSQYNELRIKAIDKMAGDPEGLRMPDAGFAGYGFSLSMPHNVLRARTRAARVGNQQQAPQQQKEEDESIDDGLTVPPCTPIQTFALLICITLVNVLSIQEGASVAVHLKSRQQHHTASIARRAHFTAGDSCARGLRSTSLTARCRLRIAA